MEAAAGKGANAVSQSAECLSCHMTLKVNPVTLASYGQAPMGLEGSKVVRQFGVYSIVW